MSKSEADWCKKIEIWWLLRDMKNRSYKNTTISWGEKGSIGCEVNLWDNEPFVRFHYTQTDNSTGEKNDFDYKVPLVKTQCHFGSTRYWFKCSLYKSGQYCGRRVGVLYKDGDWFGCRHCYDLTYSSKNSNPRYKHYPIFRILDLDTRIEKAYEKAKRYTYRGKPTKKRRKIERLNAEAFYYYKRFQDTEKGLKLPERDRNK